MITFYMYVTYLSLKKRKQSHTQAALFLLLPQGET